MKVSGTITRGMALDLSCTKKDPTTMVNGKMDNAMGKVNCIIYLSKKYSKANGLMTRCMDQVQLKLVTTYLLR